MIGLIDKIMVILRKTIILYKSIKEVINMPKTFWKCTVCGDVHYGNAGPEICPTCMTKNAYKKIDAKEAKDSMKL